MLLMFSIGVIKRPPVWEISVHSFTVHCEKIRRFYGKIPGIWLPVLLPLFVRAFTCRTFLEIKIW